MEAINYTLHRMVKLEHEGIIHIIIVNDDPYENVYLTMKKNIDELHVEYEITKIEKNKKKLKNLKKSTNYSDRF